MEGQVVQTECKRAARPLETTRVVFGVTSYYAETFLSFTRLNRNKSIWQFPIILVTDFTDRK